MLTISDSDHINSEFRIKQLTCKFTIPYKTPNNFQDKFLVWVLSGIEKVFSLFVYVLAFIFVQIVFAIVILYGFCYRLTKSV